MTGILRTGLLLLTVSGAFLYAFPSASLPYLAVVLGHVAGGFVFTLLLLAGWRRLPAAGSGWGLIAGGAALGIVLAFTGAARPAAGWFYGHIAASAAGVLLLVFAQGPRLPRRSPALRATGLVLLALLTCGSAWIAREEAWRGGRIENPSMPPASQDEEGAGLGTRFFPSSARTSTGGEITSEFFMQSQTCARCHADIYRQWSESAHKFSSFNNPWYRKSIEYMQDVVGVEPSRWCAGCHDPALLYSGKFDAPARQIADAPESHAGLGCVMCHSLGSIHSTMGQGDFTVEYPLLAKLAANPNRYLQSLHDILVRLNPEPHRRTFMRPFVREQTGEFCSSCHKVHLDRRVNDYRWIRGFNDYDNWQASGVSGLGARSFYYPAQSRDCADCHMPLVDSRDDGNIDGKVHSHRFPGANTALPVVNAHPDQLKAVTDFLQDGVLSVDVFALSKAGGRTTESSAALSGATASTFAVGEEADSAASATSLDVAPLAAPLDRVAAAVTPGESYRVDVVVRTRKIGHFFPGGTVDAFDVWVELEACDDTGRVLLTSGSVEADGKGPVDKSAHFYRSLQVDAHGNPINKRNAWATRSLVYVRLIPPGAADTVHYRLDVPQDVTGRIHLRARVLYRKFAWWYTQFTFAGERVPGTPQATKAADDGAWMFRKGVAIPDVPIVTLAESTTAVTVGGAFTAAAKLDPRDWERWNDYGIGLLLQGDSKGAASAFSTATAIDPQRPDGWVNIARARLLEGDLEGSRLALDRALTLAPNLARAHYFYGRLLRDEGDYAAALDRMRRVLGQYPKDRVVRNDAGRLLFLQKKYAAAIAEFRQVLAVDPEDLQAHYNLMLCYNGLGMDAQAKEHEKRYLRFKADESAQAITGPYRLAHPEDNNERQSIHEHLMRPPATR